MEGDKLLIVHGWSDNGFSFSFIQDFLIKNNLYKKENIRLINYASLDDESTFNDFSDRFNEVYNANFKGERIDVLCHSTGSLVTRAWLALRRIRQEQNGEPLDVPVKRLFLFAPANFGSDLAKLGQSFINRLSFLVTNRNPDEPGQVGVKILQGLEPASPTQWELSTIDLHSETYFSDNDPSGQSCFPFIFAGGRFFESLGGRIISARIKPGTDGTIRVCGTSLNTRKCIIRDIDGTNYIQWAEEYKFPNMPFAVFPNYDHGTIIKNNPDQDKTVPTIWEPGDLLKKAKKVTTVTEYNQLAQEFAQVNQKNYNAVTDARFKDKYQQFFFRVSDDADFPLVDFNIDFYVENQQGKLDPFLTQRCDREFQQSWSTHSVDPSNRVLLVNLTQLKSFLAAVEQAKARLVLQIFAPPPYRDVYFESLKCVVFDSQTQDPDNPKFLFPNTTTLVEVILNRKQLPKVLNMV